MSKLKILFETWHGIPHSYGIVAAFLLIHFEKFFSDKVEIYVREPQYFREHWNACKGKWVYTESYNKILESLKQFVPGTNQGPIDVVYRQTYPYNLSQVTDFELLNAKVVVFYTSEFANLDLEYFHIDNAPKVIDDSFIRNYILTNKNLSFTSPSKWSDIGLTRFTNGKLEPNRNKIVTHGVDTSIYKKLENGDIRKRIRQLYNISETDIVLLNIGAMTQNKGIIEILVLLTVLIFNLNMKNIKLMLKGSGDLYSCKEMIENYMGILQQRGVSPDQIKILLKNHIIFTEQTLTCTRINDLYNACDIYISPYIAEGFNLTVLEAIAAGLPTIVSDLGSTKDFIDAIINAVPQSKNSLIYPLSTQIVTLQDNKQVLQISIENLIQTTINAINNLSQINDGDLVAITQFLEKNYSWKVVCEELINLFY